MKNPIRILATESVRTSLECAGQAYGAHTEYFADGEGRLIERIACEQPDAVIINLFMPGTDAVEVIRSYRMLYEGTLTYFAVAAPFVTAELKRELDECGVKRVIGSARCVRELIALLDEVSRLRSTPFATQRCAGINTVHALHRRHEDALPDVRSLTACEIDEIFEAFGLNKNDAGCVYLRSAVTLAAADDGAGSAVTKRIYPAVASIFGTTPSCVERRIRGAIVQAWHSGHSSVIAAYFGYTVDNMRGRPTNGEFISMLADRIRLEIR